MSVRRRSWTTRSGEPKEAWIADYVDQHGARHIKTFARKKDADRYHSHVAVDVGAGIHTADSSSITVAEAGRLWLQSCEAAKLERETLEQYQRQFVRHIIPFIGAVKLAQLSIPAVRAFEDRLRVDRSPALVRKILISVSSILTDAQERGLAAQNVVRSLRGSRRGDPDRRKGKLKVGTDIPSPDEIRAILAHLTGRARPLLLTAIFAGLRASELRGLRWADLDLKRGELRVHQRADRYGVIGRPKSTAGQRSIPLMPMVVNALREWKLVAPKSAGDIVFPGRHGQPISRLTIASRMWQPVQVAAGIVGKDGRARYPGLHALRHFFASLLINRRVDGGLELPLKVVQVRLGHASIAMTSDVYGHLFPRGDDAAEMAAAERLFLV